MKRLATFGRTGPGLLVLALQALPLAAQSEDRGTLLIRAGTREVGSESFRIVTDSAGVRVSARAVYGTRGTRTATELTATLDRGHEGELAFQLDRRAGTQGVQVYAVQKRNRITVRRVERGAEQASELPGSPTIVLLADSVFSLFYQIVPLAADNRPVSVLFPQGTRRLALTLERVASGGRTLIRFRGGLEGELELGNRGEVLRIQLPSLGLEAVRKRD
jgi:hypothetical protein